MCNRLLGTGAVDGAVIIEKSTGNILAASPGFSVSITIQSAVFSLFLPIEVSLDPIPDAANIYMNIRPSPPPPRDWQR